MPGVDGVAVDGGGPADRLEPGAMEEGGRQRMAGERLSSRAIAAAAPASAVVRAKRGRPRSPPAGGRGRLSGGAATWKRPPAGVRRRRAAHCGHQIACDVLTQVEINVPKGLYYFRVESENQPSYAQNSLHGRLPPIRRIVRSSDKRPFGAQGRADRGSLAALGPAGGPESHQKGLGWPSRELGPLPCPSCPPERRAHFELSATSANGRLCESRADPTRRRGRVVRTCSVAPKCGSTLNCSFMKSPRARDCLPPIRNLLRENGRVRLEKPS